MYYVIITQKKGATFKKVTPSIF